MNPNAGKSVRAILRGKQGRIRRVRLPRGAPSWDDILDLAWEEVEEEARMRTPGFATFRKLLTDREYDR